MYCHAIDHDTKYFLTLMTRIQEKRNENNQNVQWISMETKEYDGKNINIVTRGQTKTGSDAAKKNRTITNGSERIQHMNNILMHARKRRHSSKPDKRFCRRILLLLQEQRQ
jgi:hypothetical protein